MKSIGFPISTKENEFRRALLPSDIEYIKHKDKIYLEEGYGKVLGIDDCEYSLRGVNICSKSEVLRKDIICDPKIGDALYLNDLRDGTTLFGWVHAVQNIELTDLILGKRMRVYAWEDMFYNGRHIFYRNNEIAGEAAIIHAFLLHGILPYGLKIAVIGKGNIARGAIKILNCLGAEVIVYDRKSESLLREEISQFDAVVNALLWDTNRKDHIVYRDDLNKMKKGSIIIDISCDRNGAIETCVPTSIENPVYHIDGIVHYAVDHTPSLFYKSITQTLSSLVVCYLDQLLVGIDDAILNGAKIIDAGKIVDERIIKFQNRDS